MYKELYQDSLDYGLIQPNLRVDYDSSNEHFNAFISIQNEDLEAIVSISVTDESYEGQVTSLDFQMIDELT